MDKISRAYSDMILGRGSWFSFSHDLPTAILFHDSVRRINENVELDNWVYSGEPDYPTKPSYHFMSDILSRMHSMVLHDTYMATQHNQQLASDHASKLTPLDMDHINKLVVGGMGHGHSSGSHDINDFLWKSHAPRKLPPTSFTRTAVHPVTKPDEDINLTHIDEALRKTELPGTFHSFHGLGFNPADHLTDQNALHLPAYSSGSVNRSIALKYASFAPNGEHHVLHMIHPPGSKGVYLGNGHFLDNEVLLPRHITVNIHGVKSYDVDGKKVNVWVGNRFKQAEGS